jgi:hypothetical protein
MDAAALRLRTLLVIIAQRMQLYLAWRIAVKLIQPKDLKPSSEIVIVIPVGVQVTELSTARDPPASASGLRMLMGTLSRNGAGRAALYRSAATMVRMQ